MHGSGRRRRRRSGSRPHHKRRREREDPAKSMPSRPPFEEYWSSPPTGWHGSAGGLPTPGYPPRPGPPPGPGYALRPALPRYDPYAYHPGNEVPPPPGMDVGKGRKGKGKLDDSEGRGSDGLILSNVPPELNTLDALNRHFRHFGEVVKIISQVSEGKAYVQFASKASAEAAAQAPALERPEIVVAWQRPKGKGSAKGKSDRPAEHRVLCTDPEERRKIEDIKVKREEVASRKTALLANLTNQMKAIMAKISDENVSEAKRETLRSLLLGLKEKLDSLSGPSKQEFTRTLMDHPRYEPSRDTRDVDGHEAANLSAPVEAGDGHEAAHPSAPVEAGDGHEAAHQSAPVEAGDGHEAANLSAPVEAGDGPEAANLSAPVEAGDGHEAANLSEPVEAGDGHEAANLSEPVEAGDGHEAVNLSAPVEAGADWGDAPQEADAAPVDIAAASEIAATPAETMAETTAVTPEA